MRYRLAVATFAVAGTVLWLAARHVPSNYMPWRPLDVAASPTFVTPWKLWLLERRPSLCDQALRTSGLRYERLSDQRGDAACPLTNTVRVSGADLNRSFVATCPLAVSFALWRRHVVVPAARLRLDSGIRRIDHLGTYACRNIYGRARGRRSEHATANAIDIAAITLADGRRISIDGGWSGRKRDRAFMHDVRNGACRFFDVVLSPDYNAAHRDHLHFDKGPFRSCR